jgi:adenine-specific DNA-methyltransferase
MKNAKKNKSEKKKKSLGQYFTTDISLKNAVCEFIKNIPSRILEPCVGQGHLVSYILNKFPTITIDMYEIDKTIDLLEDIDGHVNYCDFLQKSIDVKYNTIVGNPPFVRTKTGNLYIDFIQKCYNLLHYGGELIFIVPSDFFKLTSSVKIIKEMILSGTFTDIYHPNKENLFQDANIDVLVFRYCKDPTLTNDINYNSTHMKLIHNNGLITFKRHLDANIQPQTQSQNLSDIFNIYVGLVSGREEVFKHPTLSNIEVLNGENAADKYIFIEKFPSENTIINDYLLHNKQILLDRAIKSFTEKNWFEWGAPRNIKVMQTNVGKPCIYVYNLTRQENVAFIGKVQYFGGGLLMMLPKETLTKEQLKIYVNYLNSQEFKQSFTFSGRFKIGQRQLCNCQI